MINHFAVVDAQGRVERLLQGVDDFQPDEGFAVVSLSEAVRGWPEGQGELRCTNDGLLYWHDTRTLAEAKADKWEQIKAARTAYIDAGLTTPYGTFQVAPPDRQNIAEGVLLARTLTDLGQPVSISWTLVDNTVVTLDATAMTNVGLLLGQRVQQAHATGRALRAAIDAATTNEEADAVQWPQE